MEESEIETAQEDKERTADDICSIIPKAGICDARVCVNQVEICVFLSTGPTVGGGSAIFHQTRRQHSQP